jgi:hypothetical protein
VRIFPRQDYNPKDLNKLEELGYDVLKYNPNEDYDRYTWYYRIGTGFRIDYASLPPSLLKINGCIINS